MTNKEPQADMPPSPSPSSLQGQLLIAMPNMEDTRFAKSLVFMCQHDEHGSMGLIINKTYPELGFLDVTEQLGLLTDTNRYILPEKTVCYGGPIDPGRGFVLHSNDYFHKDYTQILDDHFALTASIDIIEAIANHKGPKRSLLALGYAGWSSGQLEDELLDNGWLHCPATTSLVFSNDHKTKYDKALKSIGITQDFLSTEAGHA